MCSTFCLRLVEIRRKHIYTTLGRKQKSTIIIQNVSNRSLKHTGMANRKEKQALTVSEGESEALYTLEVIKYNGHARVENTQLKLIKKMTKEEKLDTRQKRPAVTKIKQEVSHSYTGEQD